MRDLDWKILISLYESRNITKTAGIFFLSQPTLTKKIQQYEEELNCQLIIRNTKGISFTESGLTAVKYGAKILKLIDELHKELSITKSEEKSGTLKIGISGSISSYVSQRFLIPFSEEYPRIKLEISNYIIDDTIELVEKKKLDIGFVCTEVYSAQIKKYKVRKEQCYLVSKEPVELTMLPQMRRVKSVLNDYSKNLLINWWNERFTLPPVDDCYVENGDVTLQMLKKKSSYGLIFYRGNDCFSHNGLHAEPIYFLDGTPVARNSWLIYHLDNEMNPLIQQFLLSISECNFE